MCMYIIDRYIYKCGYIPQYSTYIEEARLASAKWGCAGGDGEKRYLHTSCMKYFLLGKERV